MYRVRVVTHGESCCRIPALFFICGYWGTLLGEWIHFFMTVNVIDTSTHWFLCLLERRNACLMSTYEQPKKLTECKMLCALTWKQWAQFVAVMLLMVGFVGSCNIDNHSDCLISGSVFHQDTCCARCMLGALHWTTKDSLLKRSLPSFWAADTAPVIAFRNN